MNVSATGELVLKKMCRKISTCHKVTARFKKMVGFEKILLKSGAPLRIPALESITQLF